MTEPEDFNPDGVPCPTCGDDCERLVFGLWWCGTCGRVWTLLEVSAEPE